MRLYPSINTQEFIAIEFNSQVYNSYYKFNNTDYLILVVTNKPHNYQVSNLLSIEYVTEDIGTHQWIVTDINDGLITLTCSSLTTQLFNGECLIKQTPIGGGCWNKTFTDNYVGFRSQPIACQPKNILLDDRDSIFSQIMISEIDNSQPSDSLFIAKGIKNSFNHEKTRNRFKTIGDKNRLYLFLPSKQNTVSQTGLICLGEVKNEFTGNWCIAVIGSLSNEIDQDMGFNYAFLYPDWSIDIDTGYLICKSFKSYFSDSRIRLQSPTETILTTGYYDSGYHVYPINIPYTTM